MVRAGERCAVNVQGLEVTDIHRGNTLCRPDTLFPSRRWLVRLQCLESAPRPLRQRTEVHFHHATQECAARVVFFDRDRLAPGDSCLAELRFSTDMVGVFGDHCVLRAYSPLRTVAGGTIVSPLPPLLRRKDPDFQNKLDLLARLPQLAAPDYVTAHSGLDLTRAALNLSGSAGASHSQMQVLTGQSAAALQKQLVQLSSQGEAICWHKEGRMWIASLQFEALIRACLARATTLHAKNPLKPSLPSGALCAGWGDKLPQRLVARVLDAAQKQGLLVAEGDGLRLASHKVTLASDQEGLSRKLLEAHTSAGLTPPNLKDVLEELGVGSKEAAPVLRLLCEQKKLVRVRDGLYYSSEAVDEILEKVRLWFSDHEDLDVGGLKELLGLSRKYLIALLEFMDREKITVRVGDARQYRGR